MHRWLFGFAALLLVGCADAALEATTELENPCPAGYEVGADGECSVPSIGECDEVEDPECATPDEPFVEPTLDNSDIEEARGFFLNQEGDGKYFVYVGETVTVGVRAITYSGEPAPGHRISFEKIEVNEERPSQAVLGSRLAETNEFGVAHIEVTGGPHPSFFKLQMTGDETAGLTYQVNVIQRPEGRDPGDPNQPPPDGGDLGGRNCMETLGTYRITNLYEPARFLGDGVFEALDTVRRALQDPGGLIGDLIRDRIDGIWGSIIRAAIRPVINYLFEYVVANYAPEWLQWMLILTEDISAVLTQLEIEGTMELSAVDAECNLTGLHRWETLVFIWRAGCPAGDDQCGRFPIPLAQLGVGLSESAFEAAVTRTIGPSGTMEISEHTLQLNLGVAVIWFVTNVILPNRLNVNSFGELLQLVLPCDAVGALAADYVGGSIIGFAVAPFVERACEAGMEAAGNWLTRQIADQFNVDSFPMSGRCDLRDEDGDRDADKLLNGRWDREGGLQGDFTGQRVAQ